MNITDFKEQFDQLQVKDKESSLGSIREQAFSAFSRQGIPTVRHEEWKYTRISSLFNKDYSLQPQLSASTVTASDLDGIRLPGYEEANELVFVNGIYNAALSTVRSASLIVKPLEEAAAGEEKEFVLNNLGHSNDYLEDGINSLSTAFIDGGIFIQVKRGKLVEHPVYIYNITDARSNNVLAQPRTLIHIGQNAQIQIVETFATLGSSDSITNQVMEMAVEQDANVEYYKLQYENSRSNQVSSTHIRQLGKSYVHTVVISLDGGIVRNNLNIIMEAERCEAHLYGLYFLHGNTHVDNHTIVDNRKPYCFSNEFYKGIINDSATGVFNGKIYVQPDAQKINAYQSNKNILLSDTASVNTKPQLEIFADDVKCSHGCTIGQLDEEAMFYLRARGVREKTAKALLVHAFAVDVLEHIKPAAIRRFIDDIISERLDFELHD